MKKPKTELTQLESRILFKNLSQSTFKGLSCDELNKLADSGITLKFSRGMTIAKRNESVLWFGVLLEGEILLSIGQDSLGTIKPGSLIGSLTVLEYKPSTTHIFDLTGSTDGLLSCFLIEDLSNIHRKLPKLASKFIEAIGKQCLNSISYNFSQQFYYSSNALQHHEYSTRRKQEFIQSHHLLANSEIDRIDVKYLATAFKVIHFKENSWITRKNTIENSVFFVIEGKCGNFESREYEDDVFGAEHFLVPGTLWEYSVVGTTNGTLLWMKLEDFNDVLVKYSSTCVKFIKILAGFTCRKIFDRKTHKLPISLKIAQDFVELDPSQLSEKTKLNNITEESDEDEPKLFPLYTFPMFEQKTMTKEEAKRPESPDLLFPKERLAKQMIEINSKKRKTGRSISPRVKRAAKAKEITGEVAEIVKEIVVDIKNTEEINSKLLEEIQKMKEENAELERLIYEEGLEIESKEVRLRKSKVLKDIERLKEPKDINLKVAPSFQQITAEQIKTSKEFYLAWKYGEKWKAYIKRMKQIRLDKKNTFIF